MGTWRAWLAVVATIAAALLLFGWVTEGFSAVTSDGARRARIMRHPLPLPDIRLIDAQGRSLSLAEYGSARGRATFVTLAYLRCQSVCLTSMSGQSWLQGELLARGLQERIGLLTLSFDPANDSPEVMADHARRLGARMPQWRFATVSDKAQLQNLLDFFGIVVLADGRGGYSHNAALFLIDERGRLSRADDIDRPDVALEALLRGRDPS